MGGGRCLDVLLQGTGTGALTCPAVQISVIAAGLFWLSTASQGGPYSCSIPEPLCKFRDVHRQKLQRLDWHDDTMNAENPHREPLARCSVHPNNSESVACRSLSYLNFAVAAAASLRKKSR